MGSTGASSVYITSRGDIGLMHRGYIKLWRAIWDNEFWPVERPYTRPEAWLDMLMLANFKTTSFRKRGKRVEVRRGQLGRSIKGLADRWNWSQGKVDRYLVELSEGDEPQIEYQKSNLTTIITIINYEKYQGDSEQNGEQTETKRGADGDQTETSKEVKELNKKVKKEYISPRLGEFKNVRLTEKDINTLIKGTPAYPPMSTERRSQLIEDLSAHIAKVGDKYKNHYATIQTWNKRDGNGATKSTAPTMTAEQEAKRNMLKNEQDALYQRLEDKKQVPENHPVYAEAQRAIKGINKRIDEIERELEG
jgi:hypothetical protein